MMNPETTTSVNSSSQCPSLGVRQCPLDNNRKAASERSFCDVSSCYSSCNSCIQNNGSLPYCADPSLASVGRSSPGSGKPVIDIPVSSYIFGGILWLASFTICITTLFASDLTTRLLHIRKTMCSDHLPKSLHPFSIFVSAVSAEPGNISPHFLQCLFGEIAAWRYAYTPFIFLLIAYLSSWIYVRVFLYDLKFDFTVSTCLKFILSIPPVLGIAGANVRYLPHISSHERWEMGHPSQCYHFNRNVTASKCLRTSVLLVMKWISLKAHAEQIMELYFFSHLFLKFDLQRLPKSKGQPSELLFLPSTNFSPSNGQSTELRRPSPLRVHAAPVHAREGPLVFDIASGSSWISSAEDEASVADPNASYGQKVDLSQVLSPYTTKGCLYPASLPILGDDSSFALAPSSTACAPLEPSFSHAEPTPLSNGTDALGEAFVVPHIRPLPFTTNGVPLDSTVAEAVFSLASVPSSPLSSPGGTPRTLLNHRYYEAIASHPTGRKSAYRTLPSSHSLQSYTSKSTTTAKRKTPTRTRHGEQTTHSSSLRKCDDQNTILYPEETPAAILHLHDVGNPLLKKSLRKHLHRSLINTGTPVHSCGRSMVSLSSRRHTSAMLPAASPLCHSQQTHPLDMHSSAAVLGWQSSALPPPSVTDTAVDRSIQSEHCRMEERGSGELYQAMPLYFSSSMTDGRRVRPLRKDAMEFQPDVAGMHPIIRDEVVEEARHSGNSRTSKCDFHGNCLTFRSKLSNEGAVREESASPSSSSLYGTAAHMTVGNPRQGARLKWEDMRQLILQRLNKWSCIPIFRKKKVEISSCSAREASFPHCASRVASLSEVEEISEDASEAASELLSDPPSLPHFSERSACSSCSDSSRHKPLSDPLLPPPTPPSRHAVPAPPLPTVDSFTCNERFSDADAVCNTERTRLPHVLPRLPPRPYAWVDLLLQKHAIEQFPMAFYIDGMKVYILCTGVAYKLGKLLFDYFERHTHTMLLLTSSKSLRHSRCAIDGSEDLLNPVNISLEKSAFKELPSFLCMLPSFLSSLKKLYRDISSTTALKFGSPVMERPFPEHLYPRTHCLQYSLSSEETSPSALTVGKYSCTPRAFFRATEDSAQNLEMKGISSMLHDDDEVSISPQSFRDSVASPNGRLFHCKDGDFMASSTPLNGEIHKSWSQRDIYSLQFLFNPLGMPHISCNQIQLTLVDIVQKRQKLLSSFKIQDEALKPFQRILQIVIMVMLAGGLCWLLLIPLIVKGILFCFFFLLFAFLASIAWKTSQRVLFVLCRLPFEIGDEVEIDSHHSLIAKEITLFGTSFVNASKEKIFFPTKYLEDAHVYNITKSMRKLGVEAFYAFRTDQWTLQFHNCFEAELRYYCARCPSKFWLMHPPPTPKFITNVHSTYLCVCISLCYSLRTNTSETSFSKEKHGLDNFIFSKFYGIPL
ncbi:hypothetical protein IE077_002387 [Cardiosporidium cionae]|uniref:Uncharacterized protein n=1 Tax=Cardiosporidium cionae TaxID=476202 RepID=A0ABQ7JFT9_9APIC|nr:hypothetical protein IE077_002387 [Cardiosporidium cionae]|eukprot:KAF8822843.1 hypothetical protein IE077_002387 [Cardiosporidium cionae]